MTQEEFQKLSPEKQSAEIERFNEMERVWRGICRRCGAQLQGTLKDIRSHVCNPR